MIAKVFMKKVGKMKLMIATMKIANKGPSGCEGKPTKSGKE